MKNARALLFVAIGMAAVEAFSISGGASINKTAASAGGSVVFPRIPGFNAPLFRFLGRRTTTTTTTTTTTAAPFVSTTATSRSAPSMTTGSPTDPSTTTGSSATSSTTTGSPTDPSTTTGSSATSSTTTGSPTDPSTTTGSSATSSTTTGSPTDPSTTTGSSAGSSTTTGSSTSPSTTTGSPTTSSTTTGTSIDPSSTTGSPTVPSTTTGSSTSSSSTDGTDPSSDKRSPRSIFNLPDLRSLIPDLPSSGNSTNVTPSMNFDFLGVPQLSMIPGVSAAIEDAREHVTQALQLGSNFSAGIEQAVQEAVTGDDPTSALRTIVQTILDAYTTVAENCPFVVVGNRVLQEGIRLAMEVGRSAQNIIFGTTAAPA